MQIFQSDQKQAMLSASRALARLGLLVPQPVYWWRLWVTFGCVRLPADHDSGCTLDPVHWLRHATGAAIRLVTDYDDEDDKAELDRVSALILLSNLEQVAEFSESWGAMTLREFVVTASPANDQFPGMCTCTRQLEEGGQPGGSGI